MRHTRPAHITLPHFFTTGIFGNRYEFLIAQFYAPYRVCPRNKYSLQSHVFRQHQSTFKVRGEASRPHTTTRTITVLSVRIHQ
jgi:hypothetical protein